MMIKRKEKSDETRTPHVFRHRTGQLAKTIREKTAPKLREKKKGKELQGGSFRENLLGSE